MPELHFTVRWPDGTEARCWSPSLVVRDYLREGASYPVEDFVARAGTALRIGSDRVAASYGFGCANAMWQLTTIEETARRFAATPAARVAVEAFE